MPEVTGSSPGDRGGHMGIKADTYVIGYSDSV